MHFRQILSSASVGVVALVQRLARTHRARIAFISAAFVASTVVLTACGARQQVELTYGSRAMAYLKSIVLTPKNIPKYLPMHFTQWRSNPVHDSVPVLCPQDQLARQPGIGYISTDLIPIPNFGPEIQEQILQSNSAQQLFERVRSAILKCHVFSVIVDQGASGNSVIHPLPLEFQVHMKLMPTWKFGAESFSVVERSPWADNVTQDDSGCLTPGTYLESGNTLLGQQFTASAIVLRGDLVVVVSVATSTCSIVEGQLAPYVTNALSKIIPEK